MSYKVSYYPDPGNHGRSKIKVELDLSNYATQADLKRETGVETFNLPTKSYLASLKPEVDKIDVDKLNTILGDLSKLSNIVDNVLKKTVYDELFVKVNATDSSKLVKKNLVKKIKELKIKLGIMINTLLRDWEISQ